MKRRTFIAGLGSAAASPLVARAQQGDRVRRIGVLIPGDEKQKIPGTFRQGLGEVGYVEGRNVEMEYRYAENQMDRLPAPAADLVRRRVAVIVASPARSRRQRDRWPCG